MKIKKITKCKSDHTWDIEVSPSHSYLLSNGCVSHNTSAQVSGATNGIELIRDYITTKITKDTVSTFIVPNLKSLKSKYTIVWNVSNEDILNINGVMQKFIDQTISTNTYSDPRKYQDNKIPMSILKKEILYAYKIGIKTLYYCNTYVENTEGSGAEDNSCESGACKL